MKRIVLFLVALLCCTTLHAQGGRSDAVAFRPGVGISGVSTAICAPLATTAASVTSNLATFTMTTNPVTAGFVSGMQVLVAGFTGGDTYFNAGIIVGNQISSGYTILTVTPTTIVVALTHANASAATNGTVLQEGNSLTPCAALSTTYTDSTLATPSTNPVTTDGLGNVGFWLTPGQYYEQFYGGTVTTSLRFVSVACVPQNTVNCGALLGTPNTWTALQTFSSGLTSSGPNTLNGGGTLAGTFAGTPSYSGSPTFNASIFTQNVLPVTAGLYNVGASSVPYSSVNIGAAAGTYTSQTSNASTARSVMWPDASGISSLALIEYCGATSGATQACAKTVQNLPIVVFGDVTLNTATTQAITTLPFTAAADYSCSGSDLTTAAGTVSFPTYTSGAQVTIQETNGANTDHLRWMCVGF